MTWEQALLAITVALAAQVVSQFVRAGIERGRAKRAKEISDALVVERLETGLAALGEKVDACIASSESARAETAELRAVVEALPCNHTPRSCSECDSKGAYSAA